MSREALAVLAAALVATSFLAWTFVGARGSGDDAQAVLRAAGSVRPARRARVDSLGQLGRAGVGVGTDATDGSATGAARGRRPWPGGPGLGPQPTARGPTSEEVAAAMVLLAVALQSGCGVVEAIEQVASVAPASAGQELAVVAAALRWGVSDELAWGAVSSRWSRTALALRLASTSGVAPSSLLISGADDLRSTRLAALDVAAARLGVRLVVPLGVAFLPAFVLTTVVPVVLALARQVLQP